MDLYLGVDVGSVTTKFVLIDEEKTFCPVAICAPAAIRLERSKKVYNT